MTGPTPMADAGAGTGGRRVGWWRATRASLGAGLGRPPLWPFALVVFLLRGGWALFVLPIVVVPSTVGIATFLGPTAITPAGPSAGLVALATGCAVAVVAWFVLGGLVAAASEALLIVAPLADATGPDGGAPGGPPAAAGPVGIGLAARMLLARVVASLPLGLAAAWGVARAVSATYAELITPTDTATPLPFRVLRDVPEAVALILVAWLAAETVGAVAVRRIVLLGEGVARSVALSLGHLVLHPLATGGTVLVTVAGSVVLVAPGLVVAAVSWEEVGRALAGDADVVLVLVLTGLFVVVWSSALVLAGATAAWRSVAWTLEVLRTDRERARRDTSLDAGMARLVGSDARPSAS